MMAIKNNLIICVIFLRVLLTFATADLSTTANSETSELIANFENDLMTMQENITTLFSIVNNSDTTVLATRINVIEASLYDIQKRLRDERRSKNQNNTNYNTKLEHFSTLYNVLRQRIDELQQQINRIDGQQLPTKIIDDIKEEEFSKADEKILSIGANSSMVRRVVYNLYDNNIGNFDILNAYGKRSQNIEIRFSILASLWSRMKANDHMNTYKLIELFKTIHEKVINQTNVSKTIKKMAEAITHEEIRWEIINSATKSIKINLLHENSAYNTEIQKLANAVCDLSQKFFDITIRRVVNETYHSTSKDKLVRIIFENQRISQIVPSLEAVNRKYLSNGAENDNTPLLIARYLRRLKRLHHYETSVSRDDRIGVEILRYSLPQTAGTLYLENDANIINSQYNMNLAAFIPVTDSWIDSVRKAFGNSSENILLKAAYNPMDEESQWLPSALDGFNFEFQNIKFRNRYLSVDSNNNDPILLAKKINHPNNHLKWRADMVNKEVTLTNMETDQKLCMSKIEDDDEDRYELSMRWDYNSRECRWAVKTFRVSPYFNWN